MEIYSNTEKISGENKIFKNKLLKDSSGKDESLKPNEQILSKLDNNNNKTGASPPKKLKKDNIIQKEYEETKIVKENEPNTKETFINVKSKVVFGDEKSETKTKGKVSFHEPKEKKQENNNIEKKNVGSLNETGKKQSDDDIITQELKKLSEKKVKPDQKSSSENTKTTDVKFENEVIRNSNEIPKKEKLDAEFVKKKAKITENQSEKIKEPAEEQKPIEKVQISGKKVKKVNLEEPVKVFFLFVYIKIFMN